MPADALSLVSSPMPILLSPFAVLEVSSHDTRHHIVEAAEEKSLTLDEDLCMQARTELANPRNRLAAEIAWLPGLTPRHAERLVGMLRENPDQVFEEEGLPPLVRANLMASAISVLEPSRSLEDWVTRIIAFSQAVEAISADAVMADIDRDRAEAGFPEVKSADSVTEALRDRRQAYQAGLREAVDTLPSTTLVQLATRLANETTASGTKYSSWLIHAFIDFYVAGIDSFLSKEGGNITLLTDKIVEVAPSGPTAITPLLEMFSQAARNWMFVTKPIQVIRRSMGLYDPASDTLAERIRLLMLLLFNEYTMIDASRQLLRLGQELFGDIETLARQMDADERQLGQSVQALEIVRIENTLYDLCSTAEKALENPSAGTAAEAGRHLLEQGKATLAELVAKGASSNKVEGAENAIAISVTHCAIAVGNGTQAWGVAAGLLDEALGLARDLQTRQAIDSALDGARHSQRILSGLTPVKKAPRLFTINGSGRRLYGHHDAEDVHHSYMAVYYIVILGLPIFPLCRYRVVNEPNGGYQFIGKAPLRPFDRWHLALTITATAALLLWGVLA